MRNIVNPVVLAAAVAFGLAALACSDGGSGKGSIPEGAHPFGARQPFVPDSAAITYLVHTPSGERDGVLLSPDLEWFEESVTGHLVGVGEVDDRQCVLLSSELGVLNATCAPGSVDDDDPYLLARVEELGAIGFLERDAQFAMTADERYIQAVHDGVVAFPLELKEATVVLVLTGDGEVLHEVELPALEE